METLIVTSAVAPYSGPSELSAFAAALGKGLRGLDHHAMIVSPLYSSVDPTSHSLARRLTKLKIVIDGEQDKCVLYDGRTTGGVDLMFIGHPAFGEQPSEDDDKTTRKAALILGQAAIALAKQLETAPEVIHAIGFQAALALPLAKALEKPPTTVLSPMGLGSQGKLTKTELGKIDPEGPLAALHNVPAGNLLAAGFAAADRIVVGSKAELDAFKRAPKLKAAVGDRSDAVTHVLAGLDAAVWNPVTDSHITARFDPASTTGKQQCKGSLQLEAGLPSNPSVALFAAVGGPLDSDDHEALEALLRNDVQVVLGLDTEASPAVAELVKNHPGKLATVHLEDEFTMHRLASGADLMWLPRSRSIGNQLHLVGLRYGALPVTNAAGPAAEVLVDSDVQLTTGNGFTYAGSDAQLSTLQRAVAAVAQDEAFEALRVRAMRTDVTWERAARTFVHHYKNAN